MLREPALNVDGQGRNAAHLRALGVALPRISDLADPPSRLAARAEEIAGVDPDRADPGDIHRTPGSESNVKEIYDACRVLARDDRNLILNQFAEHGNYVVHRAVTGPALERIFAALNEDGGKAARAFVCASGSAGTLAAGDHLKRALGTRTCVVEALECPTLHNIQGIGDKHVPLIHNVMGTDVVIGVSDRGSDALNVVFNTVAGRAYLSRHRHVDRAGLAALGDLGLSSIANVLGAIKYAKYMGLGTDDVVLTVATDGAALYRSEIENAGATCFAGEFSEIEAAQAFGQHVLGAGIDHVRELTRFERERIFNLGYYTWVEQQGTSLAQFDGRRDREFWEGLMDLAPVWDSMIDDLNAAID